MNPRCNGIVSLILVLFVSLLSVSLGFSPSFNYTDSIGRELLEYAGIAYCQPATDNLESGCKSFNGFVVTDTFYAEKTDAFAYVGYNTQKKQIVVAFKGTNPDDVLDWIDDLSGIGLYVFTCELNNNISYRGDTGFCHYYHSIEKQGLIDTILLIAARFPHYDIYLTGHSLGGAAAAILFADLTSFLPSTSLFKLRLFTYGEPRVGDHTFYQLLENVGIDFGKQTYRVTHHRDIVPHLAPCCPDLLGNQTCIQDDYCPFHHSTEIWYYEDAMTHHNFTICSHSTGEDPNCSDELLFDLSVEDHLYYFGHHVSTFCC